MLNQNLSKEIDIKKINEKNFLELYSEYIYHDVRIYPQALIELKYLVRSFSYQEMTQQSFIELIIEVHSLSHSSFDLLNQLLSKEKY